MNNKKIKHVPQKKTGSLAKLVVLRNTRRRATGATQVTKAVNKSAAAMAWGLFFLSSCLLRALSTDAASKLHIFGHNGDSFGMNGTEICVFKQAHKISFRSFLQCKDGLRTETKIILEFLSNFTNQSLEGQFADQQFSAFLITTNLTCQGGIDEASWRRQLLELICEQLLWLIAFEELFPPVDLRAVCLVRAIAKDLNEWKNEKIKFESSSRETVCERAVSKAAHWCECPS